MGRPNYATFVFIHCISFPPEQTVSRTKNRQNLGRGLVDRNGWTGGAMVLGKLPVPGRPTIWMIVTRA